MSQIIDFFLNKPSSCPYRLKYILEQNDVWMENCHDYIQWLFPLKVPSQYNPNSPLLTEGDIDIFHYDSLPYGIGYEVRGNFSLAFVRMLKFFGLKENSGELHLDNLRNCVMTWAGDFNHNHLRMTRMIKSLNLLGFYGTATEVCSIVSKYAECKESIEYWKGACR